VKNQYLNYFAGSLVLWFVATICQKQYQLLHGFHYPDFDLSIFTQGVWKLSEFKSPFVTIRGLHLFGDHTSFINLLLVPFCWVFDTKAVLLTAQTLALGASGIFAYKILSHELRSKTLIAGALVAFLSYPALLHVSLRQYHTDGFVVLFALMFWSAHLQRNLKLALVSLFLICITKENMPLLAGFLVFYSGYISKWKPIRWALPVIAIYFVVCLKVIIPSLSEMSDYHYSNRTLGSFFSVLKGEGNLFEFLNRLVFTDVNLQYLLKILGPFLFLPLLSPTMFFLNPILVINLVTDWPYAHEIDYQYVAGVIPAAFIAFVLALKRLDKYQFASKKLTSSAFLLVFAAVFSINLNWVGPGYLSFKNIYAQYPQIDWDQQLELNQILNEIGDSSVSVHYHLLPFFATRDIVYMWPDPFDRNNPGEQPKPNSWIPEFVILRKEFDKNQIEIDTIARWDLTQTKTLKFFEVYKNNRLLNRKTKESSE
jgi:uncharacterized membrane protein